MKGLKTDFPRSSSFSDRCEIVLQPLFPCFYDGDVAVSILASVIGLVPGAFGGALAVCVGHPIDLIKVRMQVLGVSAVGAGARAASDMAMTAPPGFERGGSMAASGGGTIGMLRGVFAREGFSGLYRGVSAPLLAVTPAFAISFWAYDLGCRVIRDYDTRNQPFEGHNQPLTITQVSLAGAWSGLPLAMIFGPSERVKCLMQVNGGPQYSTFANSLRNIYLEGGVKSLFRGTFSTVLRDVPGNAAYFASYEYVKRLSCTLENRSYEREGASFLGTLIAGGSAGVGNWIIAIPMDTVKSRWQTAPEGTYRNLVHVVRVTVRTEGPSALLRGLSPALLRAFPANAACLCGVETVKKLIADQ
jgi:solute carrier family 25 (mitochondrial carnitine/acylcarnitine transporter), member 20/29